jgi:hypothetical protein
MNTNESQFSNNVKVIHNAMEERGWEPEEREGRLGAKVNAFDNTDIQQAKERRWDEHAAKFKTNEARKKGTLPVVKIRSN